MLTTLCKSKSYTDYAAILYALPPIDATKICPLQTESLNPPSQVSSMIKFALQTIVPI